MSDERSEATCPADVLEAIPWYPDGLGELQRGALEAHAATCDDCRRELAFVQGEGAEAPGAAAAAERVWGLVLARMAAEDGEARVGTAPRAAPRRARRRWLGAAARPLPLAASIAFALALGALGLATGRLLGAPEAVYQVATAPPTVTGPALDVVFRKDASAGEIEAALRGIGGAVVGGPSPLGVFRVALRPGADAAVAAAALRAEADGVASLAEPIRP